MYTISALEFVVLGSQISPERNIVRITFGSVWMLLNAFRAIIATFFFARWGFELNGNVTCKLCCKNIDLVEFGIYSNPKQGTLPSSDSKGD
jgi:hypothetical protein